MKMTFHIQLEEHTGVSQATIDRQTHEVGKD